MPSLLSDISRVQVRVLRSRRMLSGNVVRERVCVCISTSRRLHEYTYINRPPPHAKTRTRHGRTYFLIPPSHQRRQDGLDLFRQRFSCAGGLCAVVRPARRNVVLADVRHSVQCVPEILMDGERVKKGFPSVQSHPPPKTTYSNPTEWPAGKFDPVVCTSIPRATPTTSSDSQHINF